MKSSAVLNQTGTSLQPSAPVAVLHCSMPIAIGSSEEKVVALTAILHALLYNQSSSDVVLLSMYAAKRSAVEHGVSEEGFQKVSAKVISEWKNNRGPIARIFGC